MDELDHRRVENRTVAGVADQARRHQQHRGADPLAAAGPDVLADLRDQRDLRLHVPRELLVDLLEVGANRFEICDRASDDFSTRFSSKLYHGRTRVWKLETVRRAISPPYTVHLGQGLDDAHDVGRFVAFPPYGTGARNGLSVSVNSRPPERREGLAQVGGLWKRQNPGERNLEAEREPGSRNAASP